MELLLQDSSRPLRSWEASDRESLEVLGEGKRKRKNKRKKKRKKKRKRKRKRRGKEEEKEEGN